ncbi:MAG: phospholipase D-like domain-containing protein [Gemmatimonadota bacterium]|nr:phospholipase D-like domain-containing protein [Gemmatimonadota bacterium]
MTRNPAPAARRPPPTTPSTAIVDNRARTVGDFLSGHALPGSFLSVVSAYFTIYGYGDLRDRLDGIGRLRFLYGDPRGVGALDPEEADDKAFRLTAEGGLELAQALRQKPLARACARWIERKADIRTVRRSNFLHGKMYHVAKEDGAGTVSGETAALVGSSNFTRRGLGYGRSPNLELNLEVRHAADREPLLRWFDDLWRDRELTRDAKQDVLDALAALRRRHLVSVVGHPESATDDANLVAPRPLELLPVPAPEAGAPRLVSAECQPDQGKARGPGRPSDAVPLGGHVPTAHGLPAPGRMAVQQCETRATPAGKANGSGQVLGREARPAVERPLALLRKDQLGDQSGCTQNPTTRSPECKAEILLTLPLPQVREEMAAGR